MKLTAIKNHIESELEYNASLGKDAYFLFEGENEEYLFEISFEIKRDDDGMNFYEITEFIAWLGEEDKRKSLPNILNYFNNLAADVSNQIL